MTEQLPIKSIRPNEYNPNRMSEERFAELVAEVRHLGRLPKPVVVRPNGTAYVIVDGEHGWRAAKECGLPEVPCEILEADDFESRRQTYKRNQHGEHNPVLLGRMFQEMMSLRGLSRRALAKEIEVSEGTIRNSLTYAKAAEARNRYAAGEPESFRWKSVEEELSELSVRQVRQYVGLPTPIGDYWLDARADLGILQASEWGYSFSVRDVLGRRQGRDISRKHLAALAEKGFAECMRPCVHRRVFLEGLDRAVSYWRWFKEHAGYFEGPVEEYVRIVARFNRGWRVGLDGSLHD